MSMQKIKELLTSAKENLTWLLFIWSWLTGLILAVAAIGVPLWITLFLIYWALT